LGPAEAENPVEQVLAEAPAPLRALAAELTSTVLRLHPGACVIAWPRQRIISFGVGPRKMSEHYCYIAIQPRHVNAGFYFGASLPDPSSLLEGTGKSLRHVKVRSLQDTQHPALLDLFVAARRERAGTPA
jgi:hypothetical protein